MLLTFFFLENLLIGGDEFGHYLSKISGNFIRKILASIFVFLNIDHLGVFFSELSLVLCRLLRSAEKFAQSTELAPNWCRVGSKHSMQRKLQGRRIEDLGIQNG